MKRLIASLFNDRAVLYGILYRAWGILAGIITIVVISLYLPPSTQGYYYTFLSLMALQVFLELGLYVVIVNFASHEWAGLNLGADGHVYGHTENLSRLVSLVRGIVKWYGLISILFILFVGTLGFNFFPSSEREVWVLPWFSLIALYGINIFFLPLISLLEGCGQIKQINKFRFTQAVISSVILWIFIFMGANLWSLVFATLIVVLRDYYLICIHYRKFFTPFWKLPTSQRIDWKGEIWPMQWRLALQAMSGYLLLQLITPIIFKYHGAIEAGRIGMSMQIIGAIQALGLVWLQSKAPMFGGLIAKKDFVALDTVWKRSAKYSIVAVLVMGIGLTLVVAMGNAMQIPIVERIVGPMQFGVLALALIFSQFLQAEAAYLRAFKREPFLVVGVVGGILAGLLIWYLGMNMGITGAIIGYALSMGFVLAWATKIFFVERRSALLREAI